MKEYTIQLSEKKNLLSASEEKVNEIGLTLQIWQDLNRMSQTGFLHPEDELVKKVLEQILEKEFNKVEDIPMPDCYTYSDRHIRPGMESHEE